MGFQGIGDEPIRRIDLQVPATGEIRLVARTLDGAAMQLIGLVVPRLERLLDRQGDLQGQRRDGLEQHAPDRGIEPAARDALTDRFGLRDPATLTDVRGPGGPLPAVIAHGHPIPTDAAHRESLEQRVPLAGGTPASVGPIRLRVLAQPALILFKVLPGDVAEMRVRDQRRPQRALDSTRGTTRGGVETDRWQVAPQLVLEPGMRLDYSTMTARTTVSPRLSAAAQLGRGWRVDGALRLHAQSPGYEKMLQADYFVDLSPDRSRGVKAERAVQGVPGVQRPLPGGFTARLDGYYKRYDDLLVGRLETDDARLA